MLFIRRQRSRSKKQTLSHQVIEAYRAHGKLKHRVVANLGQYATIEAALDADRAHLVRLRQQIEHPERIPRTDLTGAAVSLDTSAIWREEAIRCAPIVKARIALLEGVASRMSKQTGASDTTP
jgi:hypothetical protein